MTIKGTVRTVWPPKQAGGRFVVIARDDTTWRRHVLWTTDPWLASLADQYAKAAHRPSVTVVANGQHQLLTVIPGAIAA